MGNLHISDFSGESIGYFKYRIMLFSNRDNLNSSFPTHIPFLSFSFSVSQAKILNTILNNIGHLRFVPYFRENKCS